MQASKFEWRFMANQDLSGCEYINKIDDGFREQYIMALSVSLGTFTISLICYPRLT
jgi:hypothetical protein